MRDVIKRLNLRTIGAALVAGSLVLAVSAGAQARDDHWEHRDQRWHHHKHDRYVVEHRYVAERPVYVRERPVIVERPVMMAPMYQPAAPSGLNLNFNIPLN